MMWFGFITVMGVGVFVIVNILRNEEEEDEYGGWGEEGYENSLEATYGSVASAPTVPVPGALPSSPPPAAPAQAMAPAPAAPAPAAPTSFPKIWNNAGYLDPTDGLLNKSNLNGDGADLPLFDTDQLDWTCLLYTSPSPRDKRQSRMPSSA